MPDKPEDHRPTDATPPVDEINALPAGTCFGELEILRTLGVGGFGIVYLAQDHALQRLVAVKEYMPGQLAQRGSGSQVSVRSSAHVETFEVGRKSFVNEARMLARFDHRSLLKVYRFWEANGTAYMAMPYLQGQTLKQVRQSMQAPPDEAFMRRVLLPLLDGLALLHAESVYHRDIAPDNVLLPNDGAAGGGDPILLDFGAARHAIGDRTQAFTAILKPSFAPIEQYGETAGLRQGPWTDLYALGAVAHYLLLGRTPPTATSRAVADSYQPLAALGLPGLSAPLLAAIDWSLRLRPQDRPQSAAELRDALTGQRAVPAWQPPAAEASRTVPLPGLADTASFEATMPATRAAPETGQRNLEPPAAPVARPRSPHPVAGPGRAAWAGREKWLLGLGAVLLLAAAGAWWAAPGRAVDAAPSGVSPAVSPAVLAQDGATGPLQPAAAASVATGAAALPAPSSPAPAAVAAGPQATAGGNERPPAPQATGRESASRSVARHGPESAAREAPPTPDLAAAAPGATPVLDAAAAPATTGPSRVAGPPDPRAACGKRVFLAMTLCIDRLCRKPAYAPHPECVQLRELRDPRGEQRN